MRNQRSPLSLQDRYDNLQIYCQEMCEHVQDLEYELSQVHNELRYLHGFISYKKLYDEYLFFEKTLMKNMMMIFHFHILRYSLDGHLIDQGPVKTEPCTSIHYQSQPLKFAPNDRP